MTDIAAIRWIFFLQPVVLGAWFPRIPQVQATVGLGEGDLAIALTGMPLGLLVALSFGGRLAETIGTRALLTWGLGAFVVLMPLPTLAGSLPTLFAALVVAGLALAIAELGLNVTAAEVEKHARRAIMNTAHGFWSVGVLTGSAIGAVQAEAGLAPVWSIAAVSALIVIPLIAIARRITDHAMPRPAPDTGLAADVRRSPVSRPLIVISAFAFGIAMTEGAMADWAAIFMTQVFDASPGVAGAGFTVFAAFVAVGRFQGDALKGRFSAATLARAFAALALAGLAAALTAPHIAGAFVGLAILGYGVSLGFPLAISAASVLPGRSSAANVAVLTQMTLCGFLVGPPVIGLIAEGWGMRAGLAALGPALAVALICAGALRPRVGEAVVQPS